MTAPPLPQHVWLSDEFSVRLEDLCWTAKGQARCTQGRNHRGPCRFVFNPDVRLYSAQEGRSHG